MFDASGDRTGLIVAAVKSMEKRAFQRCQQRRFDGWDPRWSSSVSAGQSARMSRIRAKNTSPELTVRRIAHRLGYRFRLHVRELPGTPDLVFARLRSVIDVRGCFWHAHSCLSGRKPAVRKNYWHAKLDRNVERDGRNAKTLRQLGWRVLVIWECQTQDVTRLTTKVARFLDGSPELENGTVQASAR